MLTQKLLKPRLATIVGSGELASQQIQRLIRIFSMKRDAQIAYNVSLENINRAIDEYLQAKTGFLTDMMVNFQSYLATIHQNKGILIDGYSTEVINYLANQKAYRISQTFINRVNQEEQKIEQTVVNIKQMSKRYKESTLEIHLASAKNKMVEKLGTLNPSLKKSMEERFRNILQTPEQNLKQMSEQLDLLAHLSTAYNETTTILLREEVKFLENKANNVFDNIMRVFILELSFMKSIEFDVNNILKKIKDEQENNRKVALEEFKATASSPKSSLSKFIWDKYKEYTKFNFSLNDPLVPINLREKWVDAMTTFRPYLTQ